MIWERQPLHRGPRQLLQSLAANDVCGLRLMLRRFSYAVATSREDHARQDKAGQSSTGEGTGNCHPGSRREGTIGTHIKPLRGRTDNQAVRKIQFKIVLRMWGKCMCRDYVLRG